MSDTLYDIYIRNSEIPKRYLQDIKLIPAQIDEAVFAEIFSINLLKFVESGSNLFIYSQNVGNGKTTIAIKLMKEYINSVKDIMFRNTCPALFINVTNFLNMKKLAISDASLQIKISNIEKNILSAKLVVFDDIGVKDLTQYDLGNLYYWIDERTSNLKSCIFTSNLTPKQLQENLDDRIYSRIVNYSILKEIKDGDSRNH